MLHLAHHKEAVADAAEHSDLFREKARLADFAFAREAGLTVKDIFRPKEERNKQQSQRTAYDRASSEPFGHDRIKALIPEEPGQPARAQYTGGETAKQTTHR